jgi:hypothetical protein
LQYIFSFCLDSGSRGIFIKTLDLLKAKNTVQKEYLIAALKMFCTFNEFFESLIRKEGQSRNFLLLKDMKKKPVLLVHMTADWWCTYLSFGPSARSFSTRIIRKCEFLNLGKF